MDNGASSYRRFLDGDDSGFVQLIKDYKDGLILYLNGIVGNIHTAEELTEDTFFKVITKKPKFRGKSSFKTWLYAIGRNVAIDYLRRSSKASMVYLDDGIADEIDLEESYIKEERKIIIHRALSKLSPDYRQVLWLVYFEEFTNKEAAAIMKKSVHNIETLLYRARQKMKKELEKEGFVYEEL